ncbi:MULTISPECIES: ATP-binding protein [unclassified Coleofasciculus]|uniref:hybrid sensor histidine kinase/response regulator n=1 Tax=unclassified Coleofasciculus TaxID=2692782 RepID=UPI001882CB3A|nr:MULTISPECIES: ATP-binding protein [unclassified Coleofasciculus]MBE9129354.1 response regulator [Coleofasciculus sp. LEGE 07081]MBE9151982.1 response regulator [Coleofasciculus sp. LEGE 07092]
MMILEKTTAEIPSEETIQILVVEDEKIIALNLKENLESLGYIVAGIAASGEEAIEQATQRHPDLVLMDIRLKGDLDGIETADYIWEHLFIPVIYVTGHSDHSTLARAKMTAPFGYVLKPVKERELSVAIEIAMQRYEREQLLTAVLKGMGDGVIVTDAQGRVSFLNPMAETLTGWQLSEAKEQQFTDVFKLVDEQTQQPVDNLVTAALQQDTTIYLNEPLLLQSKNGTPIPIGDSATSIKDRKGNPIGVVVVFQDISDRKQVESMLRQQLEKEKKLNQLQTQFIHTVSHEYRTPLSLILTCAYLLETNTSPSKQEERLQNCERIRHAVKYMVGLLEDVLTFGQVEADQVTFDPAPLDLEPFCKHIIAEYQFIAHEHHDIQWVSRAPTCTAYLDKKLLQLILRNLLSNALKYSPESSSVSLIVTCQDDQAIIQVRDTGIGIPLEDQPHIFKPFHRAANAELIRGSGMGLAIVKKAVDLHGGTIAFDSKVGVGTTFTVTLPANGT